METTIQNSSIARPQNDVEKIPLEAFFYENDCWNEQPDGIATVLLKYYQDLFSIANPKSSTATLPHGPHVIIEDMKNMLTGNFLESEVVTALKQMAPLKAPGPYGIPPLFYQHFW